jgi:NTE family protein
MSSMPFFTLRCALWGAFLLCLNGCTIVSGTLGVSYQNRADVKADYVGTSAPVPRASLNRPVEKPTFVGLAISGGGSRAANFGMAVLGELQEQGILQHVDAISAVSGGSIPTAYFALHGDKPDWQTGARTVAGTNFLGAFLGKLFNPINFTMTTFTDKDRSDLLAEVFEEKVLGGSVKFADLGALGPLRPSIFFNATDTTSGGERFVFSDDRFFDRIGSVLSEYPLAWAMASSGAFPGVFNSVTLRRFSIDPEVRKTEETIAAQRHYLHLIDGGSTDNFGTSTLIDMARQHHVNALNKRRKPEGCLIMVADSHVPNAAIRDATSSDRRNPFSMLIDLNFLDAIDAMLGTRRTETLLAMGIKKHEALGRFSMTK